MAVKLSNMERMIHSISKVKKKSLFIFSYNMVVQSDKLDHIFLVRMEKLPVGRPKFPALSLS